MNRFVTWAVVAGLLAAAQAPAGDAKKELDKLQGTWTVVTVEADGKPLPAEQTQTMKLVIQGDKYTFQTGDQRVEGTYKLDPTKKPKTIDAARSDGPDKGKVLQGIYQVDGDEMKMCFGAPGNEARPKDFAAKAGEGFRLYVLKRSKP
jgi:uncharacterized protein (TIGR03067 family)